MKRKFFSIILALAMVASIATVATAADQSTNSKGSIAFDEGTVVIIVPGVCCDCFGEDPAEDCTCPCHDFDPAKTDPNYKYGGALDFGKWTVGDYGVYDSIIDGRDSRTHTAIYTVNPTASDMQVLVSVSEFAFNAADKLKGAELSLVKGDYAVYGGISTAKHFDVSEMEAGETYNAFVTSPGSIAAANWSGLLDVPPGSAMFAGEAQATLTWSVANVIEP